MITVGAIEAKDTLGTLLDRVEGGEEVVITRDGRPVARLVPQAFADRDQSAAHAAAERIRSRAARLTAPVEWRELRSDRDAGRP